MFTLPESIDDEREIDEGDEHYIQFVESREDAPEAFKTAEQSFHFVSAFVHFPIVFPRFKAIALWRNNGNETQIQRQLPCLIAFVGLVHPQVQWPIGWPKALEQGSPLRCITGLSGRKLECYGRSSIRGNHMNLGSPSGSALADSLGSFFNAPVAAMNTNIQRTVVVLISALSWPYGWIVGNRIRPSRQSLELARVRYADVLLTDQKNNSNIVPTGTTSRTFINTKGISCR